MTRPTATSDPQHEQAVVNDCRPLRADAARNRRLILDAAGAAFAEHGLTLGYDEIARAAGVGVGTVYRRFPEREDLIDALFADRIQAMVDLTVEAARTHEPWQALVWFLERSITLQARDRGFAEVLSGGLRGRNRLEAARRRMLPAVGGLLDSAQRSGVVRPDVEVLDLAMIGGMLSRLATQTNPDLWRRYLTIILDGLRARPDSERLDTAPPQEADLAQIATAR